MFDKRCVPMVTSKTFRRKYDDFRFDQGSSIGMLWTSPDPALIATELEGKDPSAGEPALPSEDS